MVAYLDGGVQCLLTSSRDGTMRIDEVIVRGVTRALEIISKGPEHSICPRIRASCKPQIAVRAAHR